MNDTPAAIGHNSEAVPLGLVLDPEILIAELRRERADLIDRVAMLLNGLAMFHVKHADGIGNDEEQGTAADYVKQLRQAIDRIEAARVDTKKPVLTAGRAIDGFFKADMAEPLEAASAAVLAKMEAYATGRAAAAGATGEKAADLTRIYSDLGTVASLAEVWTWEITDAEAVPRRFLAIDTDKIKAVLHAHPRIKNDGAQPVPGVRFYKEQKIRVR